MGSRVLGKIVAARELLATLVALKWLVVSVERAIVTLEVFLTTEATRAKGADEGFRRIFGQGLLSTTAIDWGACVIALNI